MAQLCQIKPLGGSLGNWNTKKRNMEDWGVWQTIIIINISVQTLQIHISNWRGTQSALILLYGSSHLDLLPHTQKNKRRKLFLRTFPWFGREIVRKILWSFHQFREVFGKISGGGWARWQDLKWEIWKNLKRSIFLSWIKYFYRN